VNTLIHGGKPSEAAVSRMVDNLEKQWDSNHSEVPLPLNALLALWIFP
jgi:hypothetical protein